MSASKGESSQSEHIKTQNIFVTGGTGVLGGHLIKDLLEQTDSHLTCLIRAKNTDDARARLLKFIKVYDPEEQLTKLFNKRVTVIAGDVSLDHFGLTQKEYQRLTQTIDVTLHAAASTSLLASLREIEPINVGGTKRVIDFALATKQKYMCYVSSYSVLGDRTFDPNFTFKEHHLDVGQGFEGFAYQETKFKGENLVRQATERGLKWNIFRPGQIYGESNSGRYPQGQTNVGGLFYDIFKTNIESGVALASDWRYDVTPVDYITSAIVFLALKRGRFFETYHLNNPDQKTYTDINKLIKDVGYDISIISVDEYRDILKNNRLHWQGRMYRSMTTITFYYWFQTGIFNFHHSARTDCTYTSTILKKEANITCAKLDQKLIQTYIAFGIKNDYFPQPERSRTTRPTQRRVPAIVPAV